MRRADSPICNILAICRTVKKFISSAPIVAPPWKTDTWSWKRPALSSQMIFNEPGIRVFSVQCVVEAENSHGHGEKRRGTSPEKHENPCFRECMGMGDYEDECLETRNAGCENYRR